MVLIATNGRADLSVFWGRFHRIKGKVNEDFATTFHHYEASYLREKYVESASFISPYSMDR